MIEYVIFNRELGLFFTGFGDSIFSKYIHKAKRFYSFGYANAFLNQNRERCYLNGFKVVSIKTASKELLYA